MLKKVPLHIDRKRTSDRTRCFCNGVLTFGRPRATLNKDVKQAVEQGRTRTSNKRSNKGRTSVEQARTSIEQAAEQAIKQGCRFRSNKGSNKVEQAMVEQGVEQGCTRMIEQGRTMYVPWTAIYVCIYMYILYNRSFGLWFSRSGDHLSPVPVGHVFDTIR